MPVISAALVLPFELVWYLIPTYRCTHSLSSSACSSTRLVVIQSMLLCSQDIVVTKLEMVQYDLADVLLLTGALVTHAGQTRWSLQCKTLSKRSLGASLWSPPPLTCRRAMRTRPASHPSSLCCLLAQTLRLPSCSLLQRRTCLPGLHPSLCSCLTMSSGPLWSTAQPQAAAAVFVPEVAVHQRVVFCTG